MTASAKKESRNFCNASCAFSFYIHFGVILFQMHSETFHSRLMMEFKCFLFIIICACDQSMCSNYAIIYSFKFKSLLTKCIVYSIWNIRIGAYISKCNIRSKLTRLRFSIYPLISANSQDFLRSIFRLFFAVFPGFSIS